MQATKANFLKARGLIDSPSKLCKGAFARDLQGDKIHYLDREAVQFDIVGALQRTYGQSVYGTPAHLKLEEYIYKVYNVWGLSSFCDNNDYIVIMKALDEFIDTL